LHKLTPLLGVLQDRGLQVALVTDGRMSGASGRVPAAIQVSPEAAAGGMLGRLRDGDIVRVDADAGVLEVEVDEATLAGREHAPGPAEHNSYGLGRELFGLFRAQALSAEEGGSPVQG
jgi:phosphogluconate dehydratase